MLLLVMLLLSDAAAAKAWGALPVQTATAPLGFSGAMLSVQERTDHNRVGTSFRKLILTLPSGASQSMTLNDGGGQIGNNSLNLYLDQQDLFLLVSEKDCVQIDPFALDMLKTCVSTSACPGKREYLGRFDWMNGYDPTRGDFRIAFRYLPQYDATESGGC